MLLKRQSEEKAYLRSAKCGIYECLFRCIGGHMLLKRQSEEKASLRSAGAARSEV